MDDTAADVRRLVRARYASLSGVERVAIGAQMFETARTIILASLPKGLTALEQRRCLCQRLYGSLSDKVFGSPRRP